MPLKGLKGGSGVKPLGYGLGAAGEVTDAEFNRTVLLLHADGSEGEGDTSALGDPNYKAFKDNSTSAHALTVQGNAYGNDFSPYYYADGYWSNEFDGSNDYIRLSLPIGGFGVEDFTIEYWVYHNTLSDWQTHFATTRGGTGFNLGTDASGDLVFYSSSARQIEVIGAIETGRWYHWAFVRESGTVKAYVDGTQVGTASITTDFTDTTLYIGALNPAGEYSNAYFSNVRVAIGKAIYTSNFTAPTAPFTDPSVAGEMSVEFDGSNDGLDGIGASDSNLQFGTSDFTVECWVYKEANPSGDAGIIDMRVNSGNGKYVMLGINSGGQLFAYINTAYKITASSSTQLNTNSWHHIAYTRDYSSTTGTLYLDGVSVGTWSDNLDYDESNTELNIGFHNGGGQFFNGFISNVRICKSLVYNSAFTPSTSPFTTTSQSATNCVFLGCRAKSFIDESTNNFPITLADAPRVTEFSPFNDGYWSNDFDGTSDSLTITSTAALQLSGEFTIEFFMKLDTLVVDTQHPSPITFPTNGSYQTQVYVQATDGYVALYYNANIVKSANGSIVANRWYHVAVGRDSSNQIALWLDGVRVATATNGFSVGNSSGTFRVGSYSGTGGDVNGKISNLRIVKGSDVYGYSNTTITVPTSPLTKISGTSLLTCQSNRFIDNSDSGYSLTVNGNTSIDESIPFELLSRQIKLITCQGNRFKDIIPDRYAITLNSEPKVSTNSPFTVTKTANVGSGFFNGDTTSTSSRSTTGDKVFTTSTSADWAFGTGDFTVECWVYPNGSVTDARGILSNREGGGNTYWALHYFGTTANQLHWHTGGTAVANSSPHIVTPNAWNHLAVTRESGTARMYINGVQVTTWSDSYNYSTVFHLDIAEEIYTNSFFGYIADVHIIKGTAKYTSNFTPSTSTISADSNTKILTCQYSGAVRNVGFVDESKYNHRITRNGDVSLGTFSPFSLEDTYWSWYFDGNHPIEIADSGNGLDLSGDFTLEFWAYEPRIATAGATVNMYFTIDTLDRFQFFNNGTNVGLYIDGGSVFSSTPAPLNQWNHIALVREGSGSNNLSYYLNGTRQTQATNTYSIAAASMMLGGQDRGSTTGYHGFFGYLSNFRILKGTALYSGASITVPTEPLTAITNTSLLTCQSNRFVDNSTNNMALTTANTKVLPFSPFAPSRSYSKDAVGGSAFFDGTGDFLQINPQNDKDVFNPTTTYTLEGWVYVNVDSPGTRYFISKGGTATGWSGTTGHYLIMFYYSNSVYIQVKTGSGSFFGLSGAHGPSYQWNHFAVGYNGTTTRFWWNGQNINSTTTAPIASTSTDGQNLFLGVSNDGSGSPWAGYISNVRYVRGTDIYGVGNTSITVPTSPPTAVANTNFLTTFTNAGIIDHTMKNNLESRANTRITGQQVKFGTGSIYFDGTGDDLRNQDVNNDLFLMGTSDWTLECFVYSTGTQGSDSFGATLLYIGGAGSNNAIWLTQNNSDKINGRILYNGSSWTLQLTSSASVSHNTWYHVAFELYNGTAKVFINGTSEASGSFSSDLNSTYGGRLTIGSRNATDRFFNGYLDEIRISRVGRYQGSNFTAPTKVFANK